MNLQEASCPNDAQKLTKTFPPELWEMILVYLEHSKDAENLCQANHFWIDILHPTRSHWLFGPVIPFLVPYIDSKDVSICRQVCRLWKNAVDDLIQNLLFLDTLHPQNPIEYQIQEPPDKSYLRLIQWDRHRSKLITKLGRFSRFVENYEFASVREIISFRRQMDVYTDNPFISRSVQFGQKHGQVDTQFWPDALKLLKQFGSNIWFMRLRFCHERFSAFTFLNILKGCLSHVPNLRGLRLESDSVSYKDKCNKAAIFKFKRNLARRPFPELRCLEYMHLEGYWIQWEGEFVEEISNMPSQYYSQLITLKLPGIHNSELLQPFETAGFPNLTFLNLTLSCAEDLSKLIYLNSPLQRVILDLERQVCPCDAFQVFNKFGATLSALELGNGVPCTDDQGHVGSCSFPQLRNLQVAWFRGNPIGVILAISESLPEIYLEIVGVDVEYMGEPVGKCGSVSSQVELDIVEYWERWYDAPIWRLIPNLMKLRIHGQVVRGERYIHGMYTREELEGLKVDQ